MGVWSGTDQDVYALIAMISGILAVVMSVMVILNRYGDFIMNLYKQVINKLGAETVLIFFIIICVIICYLSLRRCYNEKE